jgi:hypothetical protein
MSTTKIASFDELRKRVKARVERDTEKSASAQDQGIAVPSDKDPDDKGGASAPSDETLDGKKEKDALPANDKTNQDGGEAGKTLENAATPGIQESGDKTPGEGVHPESLPTGDLFKKKAQDVLAGLKERFGGIKAASAETEEKEESKKEAAAETEEKSEKEESKKEAAAETEKEESKKEASEEASEEESKKEAGESAEAVAADMQGFTPDFHIKLASHLLATEAGRNVTRQILSDAMSAEAVDNLIKQAAHMEQAVAAQNAFEARIKQAVAQMNDDERKEFFKSAEFHKAEIEKLETAAEKRAYEQGAMDAAAMEAAGGAMPPIPAEGEAPSIDEIVMILDQLVQSGQIAPEEAQAILDILLQEVGGAEGGAVPAEAMPAEAKAANAEEETTNSLVDDVLADEKKED